MISLAQLTMVPERCALAPGASFAALPLRARSLSTLAHAGVPKPIIYEHMARDPAVPAGMPSAERNPSMVRCSTSSPWSSPCRAATVAMTTRSAATPEHRRILALCQRQATVADIAAGTGLPLGVVRVLLSDLILSGAATVIRQRSAGLRPGNDVLQEILNGLRAL